MKVTYKKKPSYLEGVMFNDVTDLNDVLEFVKGTHNDVKVGLKDENDNDKQVMYVQVSDEILMTAGSHDVLIHDKTGDLVLISEANILKGYNLVVDSTSVDGLKTD